MKVYENIPEESAKDLSGFFRKEGEESLTYGEAKGYYAVSPADMEAILTRLKLCEKNPIEIDNRTLLDLLLGNEINPFF